MAIDLVSQTTGRVHLLPAGAWAALMTKGKEVQHSCFLPLNLSREEGYCHRKEEVCLATVDLVSVDPTALSPLEGASALLSRLGLSFLEYGEHGILMRTASLHKTH